MLKYFKNGSGNQIKDDEIMLFNLQYFDYEGTGFFKSGDQPVIIQKIQHGATEDIYMSIRLFKKGDSVFWMRESVFQ